MSENSYLSDFEPPSPPPNSTLVIILISGLSAFVFAQLLCVYLFGLLPEFLRPVSIETGGAPENLNYFQQTSYKIFMITMQAVAFGGIGVLFSRITPILYDNIQFKTRNLPVLIGLTILTIIISMPLMQGTMFDRETLQLPEQFKQIQMEMIATEEKANELLSLLLKNQFLLNVLMIAVAPAICEEIFFRGFIQGTLHRVTSPHAAVWIGAFIFSFLHFQFYGFIPRLLLGALFSYMRWWSGSLIPGMVGHFIFNGISVVVAYFALNSANPQTLNEAELQFPLWSAAISGALTVGVMLYFKKQTELPLSPSSENRF